MQKLLKIKFCIFSYTNPCKNIASLVVAKGVAKEENVLDNGQIINIFTRVIMEKSKSEVTDGTDNGPV